MNLLKIFTPETIREFRHIRGKSCPVVEKKIMQKRNRRSYVPAIDKDHRIIVVQWADNIVTVGSNYYGVQPIGYVKRNSQNEKKIVSVPPPFVISQYNSYMGGTDLMDEGIFAYRIGIRSKKWWSIFTWLLDAAMFNSWVEKCSNFSTRF